MSKKSSPLQTCSGNPKPLADRFWSKVKKAGADDCWPWTGSLNNKGYGQIYTKSRGMLAHRVSWQLNRGPIPVGLFVLHRCDNPRCVNPDHLFTGTGIDNQQDSVRKGRHKAGHNRKLSGAQVKEIRQRNEGDTAASKKYGVSRNQIWMIRSGRSRKAA